MEYINIIYLSSILFFLPLLSGTSISDVAFAIVFVIELIILLKSISNQLYIKLIYNIGLIYYLGISFTLCGIIALFIERETPLSVTVVRSVFQTTLCLMTFGASSYMDFSGSTFRYIQRIIFFTIIMNTILLLLFYPINENIRLVYSHPNFLGAYFFMFTPLVLLDCNRRNRAKKILVITILTFFIYLTGARSALLSQFIMLTIIIIPKISFKKIFSYLLMISTIFFTFIYIYIYQTTLGSYLNNLSRDIFHKNFFSGRQIIWNEMLELIYQKPFFGYGAGTKPSAMLDISLSAHNWYLQIAFQTGIIGLIVALLLILFIYRYYISKIRLFPYMVLSAFIPAMLFHELFEVMLTQNHLAVGLIVWCILGLGYNRNYYKYIIDKYNNKKRI